MNKLARPEALVAVGGLLFSLMIYWQAGQIPVAASMNRVGPSILPYMLSIGMGILSLLMIFQALRGGWQEQEERDTKPIWVNMGWVLLGLSLNVLLISNAGFTISSICLFVCIARAFGSKQFLRDACIAAIFALIAYYGFVKLLSINIGAGWLEKAIAKVIGF